MCTNHRGCEQPGAFAFVADRPHLSLAQVYAALAYYHANKPEVDADIAAEEQAYDAGVRSAPLPLRP
jgi:hypothetical protein